MMLKKAVLLTRPPLARQDAPCPRQGRSERRGEEVRTAHRVRPFALTTALGERKSPSRIFPPPKLNVESLREARTPLADFFSILLGAELNALRQRQIVTPIGGVRLTPHIGFPGIRASLAPSAGFLFASKGSADLRA
jgi:hypothetical protein